MNFLAVGAVILVAGMFMAIGGFLARDIKSFPATLAGIVVICVFFFCFLSFMEWGTTKKDKWDTRTAMQYAAVGQCKKSQFKPPRMPFNASRKALALYEAKRADYLRNVSLDNDSRPKDFAFHAKDGKARLYFHCTRDSDIYELTDDY